MSETDVLPELKQIVGAILFAAKGSVSPGEIRRCLKQVAEERGGVYRDFAEVSEKDVLAAIELLRDHAREARIGLHVNEVAGGFRMENDSNCGPWLRQLLQKGRASRLSKPALETLAVIAYRQPCTRAEIEAVRGVAVDQILRNLMDLQLIRITGRSELPGRPWMFGTTQKFLEYFGLKNVKDLPGVEELRRMEAEQEARKAATKIEEPIVEESSPESADTKADEVADEEENASPSELDPEAGEEAGEEAEEEAEEEEEEEEEEKDEDDEEDEDEYDDEGDDEDEEDDEDDEEDGDEDEEESDEKDR
ncbi:MAG TPA: SMC-Scp complex subunit ScpB [Kiritimatiellia bacterium]|nr:SMC-Scp complex subunit ScpB [Kiritimatiellia bacterium]